MDQFDTIWVLVPVYNVEKLIKKCIRSIQRQTYQNWKMVLVDDGSTDRSGEICDEFAKTDSRIKVVHTSNNGLPVARINAVKMIDNVGYCVFCDSDDEMPVDALEILYAEAKKGGADIVCGNFERIIRGRAVAEGKIIEAKIYEQEEILSNLYLSCFGERGLPVNIWGKLYKTEKIRPIMLNMDSHPHYFAEDLNVIMRLLPEISKISVISDIVYRYRVGGGTSKFIPTFLKDNLLMYQLKMQWSKRCTAKRDVQKLIGIELKNLIVTYWVMCEKNHRYSRGTLLEEIKYVCAFNEVKEALLRLEGDHSGFNEINRPLIENNYEMVCALIKKKVKKEKIKDILKKILMG